MAISTAPQGISGGSRALPVISPALPSPPAKPAPAGSPDSPQGPGLFSIDNDVDHHAEQDEKPHNRNCEQQVIASHGTDPAPDFKREGIGSWSERAPPPPLIQIKATPRPVVAGDQGGETAQRDAREVRDQRDHIDRQGQRLAQSEEKSLILPRRFPSTNLLGGNPAFHSI
jgi:hypothetical protein